MKDDYIETFSDLAEYITGNPDAAIGAIERKLNDGQFHRVKLAFKLTGGRKELTMTIPCEWLDADEYPCIVSWLPMTETRFENRLKALYEEADRLFDVQYGE